MKRLGKFLTDAYIGCFMIGGYLTLVGLAFALFVLLAWSPIWVPILAWRLLR